MTWQTNILFNDNSHKYKIKKLFLRENHFSNNKTEFSRNILYLYSNDAH